MMFVTLIVTISQLITKFISYRENILLAMTARPNRREYERHKIYATLLPTCAIVTDVKAICKHPYRTLE